MRRPIGSELPLPPHGRTHFEFLKSRLAAHEPFTFIRFSDGEMEVIRNEPIQIRPDGAVWRLGKVHRSYPEFDRKTFDPTTQQALRDDLLGAAKYRGVAYYKGVVTSHNASVLDVAVADRDMMVSFNGGDLVNMTFTDLFLNENYPRFVREIVPLFCKFESVAVVGNFRMQPKLVGSQWQLIELPDDFFTDYKATRDRVQERLLNLPRGTLVLSSASSLSNIAGRYFHAHRRDLTFIDIGTTMHGHMGLPSRTRQYHLGTERWSLTNAHKKLRYRWSSSYRLRW